MPTSIGSLKKQENSRKISTSASDCTKALTVWITTNWKVLQEMRIPNHLTRLLKTCMQVKKQLLELDMEQWTVSKSGKEYVKTVHCYPVYLTFMQSTSYEMLGWMKYKLESRLLGEMSVTSNMQMAPPLWQKGKRN